MSHDKKILVPNPNLSIWSANELRRSRPHVQYDLRFSQHTQLIEFLLPFTFHSNLHIFCCVQYEKKPYMHTHYMHSNPDRVDQVQCIHFNRKKATPQWIVHTCQSSHPITIIWGDDKNCNLIVLLCGSPKAKN